MRREDVLKLRHDVPKGTVIELILMKDDPRPIEPGTRGVVEHIDDIGNIHVDWDNGRTLAVIPEVDEYKVIQAGGAKSGN